MSRPRKTIGLSQLVTMVNDRNRASICSRECRDGWNSLLEDILMKCNAYGGFRYLRADEVPHGQLAGEAFDTHLRRIFPDETRRCYIVRG